LSKIKNKKPPEVTGGILGSQKPGGHDYPDISTNPPEIQPLVSNTFMELNKLANLYDDKSQLYQLKAEECRLLARMVEKQTRED